MATKAKEMKHRPVSTTPSSSQRNKGTGSSDKDTISSSMQEKLIPSYLRPTISSSKSLIKQHRHSESPTKKTAPINNASPSLSLRKALLSLSPCKLPHSSPLPTTSAITNKTTNVKATLPSKTNARNITKGSNSATTRKQEAKAMAQKEKVLSVDVQSKRINLSSDSEERSEGEPSLHYEASEESMCGGDDLATSEEGDFKKCSRDDIKKTILPKVSNVEREARRLNFRQGKELTANNGEKKKEANNGVKDLPAAYNVIIEETTSKLREKKNKVLALVGAFETVISLHEPEGEQSPRKGESQPGQLKDEEKVKGGEIGQESQQAKSGQTGQQNFEEGENNVVEAENLKEVLTELIVVEEKVKKEDEGGDIGQRSQQVENGETDQHIVKERENNVVAAENLKEVLTESIDVEEKVKEELTKSTKDSTNAIEEEKLTEPMEKLIAPTEENNNDREEKIASLEEKDASPKKSDASI